MRAKYSVTPTAFLPAAMSSSMRVVPHALFALAVRAVVIEVAELANQRALADAGTADDGDAHQMSTLTTLVTSSTLVSPSVSSHAE